MGNADQDRPSTWVKFRDEYCKTCFATCCMMPLEVKLHDLIRLQLATEDELPKKVANRLTKEGRVRSYRASTGLFLLEQVNGRDCQFLDKNRLCSVYENRPDVCRGFPVTIGPRPGFCPYRKKPSV